MLMDVKVGWCVNKAHSTLSFGVCLEILMIRGRKVKCNVKLHILNGICRYWTTDFRFHILLARNFSLYSSNNVNTTSVKPDQPDCQSESHNYKSMEKGENQRPAHFMIQLIQEQTSSTASTLVLLLKVICYLHTSMILLKGMCMHDNRFWGEQKGSTKRKKEEQFTVGTYHAPAVASHKVNAVVKHRTTRTTSALQNGSLENVPLVPLWVIAFHEHYIKVGET